MPKNRALINAILDREKTHIVIAKRAGIHQTRFSRIVNGHDEPSEDEKKALARVLRRPVDDLFPPTTQDAVA